MKIFALLTRPGFIEAAAMDRSRADRRGIGYHVRNTLEQGNRSSPSTVAGRIFWSIYILNKYFLKPKAPV